MVRTRLNIGCRYSTPVLERPLHPTRSQFKPQPSQTQAPVTPATEPERRAGGGLTTVCRSAGDGQECRNHLQCLVGHGPGRQAFDPAGRLYRAAGPGARDRRAPRGLTGRESRWAGYARGTGERSNEPIGTCPARGRRNRNDQIGCRCRGQIHAFRNRRLSRARGSRQPSGVRDLRHQESACSHGPQSADGRDPGNLRVHRGDLQAWQAVEGSRERWGTVVKPDLATIDDNWGRLCPGC